MEQTTEITRRDFLWKGTILAGAAMAVNPVRLLAENKVKSESTKESDDKKNEDVSPPEDLMREHGLLSRILLIYDDLRARTEDHREFPLSVLLTAAGIIRRFIEDYHEMLEEDYLFPRFEKAGKLVSLVKTLRVQHQAGRQITEYIQKQISAVGLKKPEDRRQLTERLAAFNRMYRPHKAREDTVLFPAIRSVVSPREFDQLGDLFEDREHQLFGKEGFFGIVDQVATLEKTLGIHDLAQFTPRI